MTDVDATPRTTSPPPPLVRRRWATLAGLGFAALIALDLASGVELARLAGDRFEPTWVILAGAAAVGVYGLLRGGDRSRGGLPLQALGLLGFGAAAGTALLTAPELGAYLAAAGLLGHAAWDVHHHRVERVVTRSLAEFCLALDTALAAAIVAVTLVG